MLGVPREDWNFLAEIDGAGFTTDELHLSVTTLLTMAYPSERSTPQT